MKKIKSYILIGLLALSLVGCSNKNDNKEVIQDEEIKEKIEENEEEMKEVEKEDKKDSKEDEEERKEVEEKETDEKTSKEEKKDEKVFKIATSYYDGKGEKPNPKNYKDYYSDDSGTNEYTILSSSFKMDKISLVALEFKNDDLVETDLIKEFSLEAGDEILLNIIYPEGIPMAKLKWEVDGNEDEFIFAYDGKDGNEGIEQFKY